MESVMSTDFRPERNIFARDLFDGRLAKFGVDEWRTSHEGQARCLSDNQGNYLWVLIDDDGDVAEFTENGWDNDTDTILAAVAEAFETEIFSEHEPQYWGCETNEELDRYISLAASNKA
jgi:hypothetical protein